MAEATLWALIGSLSLLVGVEIALQLKPPQRVIGLTMAFGAGAMLSAVAYELLLEALETQELFRASIGVAAGALTFFTGDLLLDKAGGEHRKRSTGEQEEGSPLAIVLGATLDAIPESIIVGMSVVLSGGASLSFVAATFLSNLPESMSATSGLRIAGWAPIKIRLLWLAVVAVSAISGAAGYLMFNARSDMTGAFVQAFAAGALLTMLADTMMPEAYRFAGRLSGLLVVAGFVTALAIAGA